MSTLKLLKTIEPKVSSDGIRWYPVSAWAIDPDEPDCGYPWRLESMRALSTEYWEYTALIAHFVSGIRDRYEHTFDAWERINPDWHGEQLLSTDWVLKEASQQLNVSLKVADQFLIWRTLHTLIPEPLLKFFAYEYHLENTLEESEYLRKSKQPDGLRTAGVRKSNFRTPTEIDLVDIDSIRRYFMRTWEAQCKHVFHSVNNEYTGEMSNIFPGEIVPLFDVSPGLSIKILIGDSLSKNPAIVRILNYALTGRDILTWSELFEQQEDSILKLKRGSLSRLRQALRESDYSGRIGTIEGGDCSDDSLRLLLRARLMNIVGSAGLWAEFEVIDRKEDNWELRLLR